eukprot:3944441-Pyramimonas_sp.AAC.1
MRARPTAAQVWVEELQRRGQLAGVVAREAPEEQLVQEEHQADVQLLVALPAQADRRHPVEEGQGRAAVVLVGRRRH